MASELFHGAPLMAWGDCIRRWPARFWLGVAMGLALSGCVAVTALSWTQYHAPQLRPTLSLVKSTIAPGEYLGFEQAIVPPQRCLQENVRMIWRQTSSGVREIYPLPDFNQIPNIWEGRSVIYLRIPETTEPGDWFYTRETAQWCSWWSLVSAKPYITRTADVPFTVAWPNSAGVVVYAGHGNTPVDPGLDRANLAAGNPALDRR
jgi:hypothetical protein